MSDEDDNVTRLSFEQPARKSEERGADKPKRKKALIPRLPRREIDPEKITAPDQRAVACVNMRLAGAPFHEIAKELDYASPIAAEQAYINALAGMFPVESWESLRQLEAMRAEQLLRRSLAMSEADYLVVEDEDGQEIQVPNTERRQWHEQAAKDLMLHATITGAKAPTRLEVSASAQELSQMVDQLVQGKQPAVEASIWDVDDIPEDVVDADVVED